MLKSFQLWSFYVCSLRVCKYSQPSNIKKSFLKESQSPSLKVHALQLFFYAFFPFLNLRPAKIDLKVNEILGVLYFYNLFLQSMVIWHLSCHYIDLVCMFWFGVYNWDLMVIEMKIVKKTAEYICLDAGIFFFPEFETDST